LPVEKISHDQRIFIQAMINEITKLFVILSSTYYKKESKMFVEKILLTGISRQEIFSDNLTQNA
jgi:hypothetical protein